MKTLKKIVWKLRYCAHLRRSIPLGMYYAWQNASAALENLNGDLSESPHDAAQAEIDEWGYSQ